MSIKWQDIDDALGAAVSAALRECSDTDKPLRVRSDTDKPLPRPSYRIDLAVADDARTAEYAERGAEAEIYYYPKDGHAPRDELLTAADALRAALGEGIDVGGVWLYLEDEIETDASDGVLAVMLRLEWVETAEEPEGEPMEELEYNNNPGGA